MEGLFNLACWIVNGLAHLVPDPKPYSKPYSKPDPKAEVIRPNPKPAPRVYNTGKPATKHPPRADVSSSGFSSRACDDAIDAEAYSSEFSSTASSSKACDDAIDAMVNYQDELRQDEPVDRIRVDRPSPAAKRVTESLSKAAASCAPEVAGPRTDMKQVTSVQDAAEATQEERKRQAEEQAEDARRQDADARAARVEQQQEEEHAEARRQPLHEVEEASRRELERLEAWSEFDAVKLEGEVARKRYLQLLETVPWPKSRPRRKADSGDGCLVACDLHGYDVAPAIEVLDKLVEEWWRYGFRSAQVITGGDEAHGEIRLRVERELARHRWPKVMSSQFEFDLGWVVLSLARNPAPQSPPKRLPWLPQPRTRDKGFSSSGEGGDFDLRRSNTSAGVRLNGCACDRCSARAGSYGADLKPLRPHDG